MVEDLNEKIKTLEEENEKLKRLNDAKSEMISMSAHQVRTSLSAFKWMLKMFLDGDLGELSHEQQGFIQKSFDSNERMIGLVSDMLYANKDEDASIPYHFENTQIEDLIDNILFEFIGEATRKGIEVIFLKSGSKLPTISTDQIKIRIVIQNLLENAIKYSNNHGKIFISAHEEDNGVEISIKNTGIGIPEKEKGLIFTKFFRAGNARQKETFGSGLGLYTAKNIVEKHKGKIWFESEENEGATFHIFLPLSTD